MHISLRLELIPSRVGVRHLLQHQHLPPSIREISGLPIASSAVSDCGTWRPQLSQSHHTVFIFSSHHLTVPSQSGLSYFVTNTCHSQQLSGDLIPFRILEEDSRKNKQYINSYKILVYSFSIFLFQ